MSHFKREQMSLTFQDRAQQVDSPPGGDECEGRRGGRMDTEAK